MDRSLIEFLPPPEALVELAAEDVAPCILQYLNDQSPRRRFVNRDNITNRSNFDRYAAGREMQIGEVISEALGWLEREGLVAGEPGNAVCLFVTRRGRAIRNLSDFAAFKQASVLPSSALDATLAQKVRATFIRGDYEPAVFQAFKEVEVRVRSASALPESVVGTALMRKAFHPDSGPLSDKSLDPGERQATSDLFAGAMGVFRNPTGHRRVEFTPAEAAELILFANHLLRLVDERDPFRRAAQATTV